MINPFFFFFQAEDGIRDADVTGVQTCALPILFGAGFYLTDERMTWFESHYLGGWTDKTDLRLSPLLAGDLSGMPPTYLVTAGFDPLRDEGEEFAERLAGA